MLVVNVALHIELDDRDGPISDEEIQEIVDYIEVHNTVVSVNGYRTIAWERVKK